MTERPRRILLLSGPSGGGKSTFVQHLTAGRLPDTILAALPSGALDWPVVDVTNTMRREIASRGAADTLSRFPESRAVILHYDITSVYRYGWVGYAADPALRLLGEVPVLDIVFVKPSASRLRAQFLARDAARQAKKSGPARLWNRSVLAPLRRLKVRMTGGELHSERDLYADPLWLERCYDAWDAFTANLLNNRKAQSLTVIEPQQTADGAPSFAFVMKSAGGSATAEGARS